MVRKYCLTGFLLLAAGWLLAQPLTKLSLEEAYTLFEARYPALRNAGLLTEIQQKEMELLDKARLPVVSLKADAQLQSQSVNLQVAEGVMLPFEIDRPLYSSKGYLEVQYRLLDGGMTKAQRALKEAQLAADLQGVEVDRFALRGRINQLFLGIVMLRKQSDLLDFSMQDLRNRKAAIAAGVENGVLLASELDRIEVRILQLKAQETSLRARQGALRTTLAQLLDVELAENVELKMPQLGNAFVLPAIRRPEQKLFQLQRRAILANEQLTQVSRRPQLSLFAQGGVGYPNPLNILDNDLAPFGIVGARFSWQLTDWRQGKLNREILQLRSQQVRQAEETFEFNLESREAAYLGEVERLTFQLQQDQEIADLQKRILTQLAAQLEEGVITTADYLIQVTAELSARQNIVLHETEFFQAQLEFWNERGGF